MYELPIIGGNSGPSASVNFPTAIPAHIPRKAVTGFKLRMTFPGKVGEASQLRI